jgi:(S)-citramalyl-CoA lyase
MHSAVTNTEIKKEALTVYPISYLFTSALSVNKCLKSQEVHADVCVIDWEDSVFKHLKDKARNDSLKFWDEKPAFKTAVRVNSLRTEFGFKDILCLAEMPFKPEIIFLSKIKQAEEINIIKDMIISYETKSKFLPKIFPLIETSSAFLNLRDIASLSDGLLFGAADYAAEIGVEMTFQALLYARNLMVAAAANFNIPCIDTTSFNIKDMNIVREECRRSKQLGFTGMAAIHPRQIAIINEVFKPTEQEIERAKYIINKYESMDQFNIIDGNVIGPPFVARAKKILKQANKHQTNDFY